MTGIASIPRPRQAAAILSHLPDLSLTRVGSGGEAGLWITSLPWPRAGQSSLALAGRSTHAVPLGQWPEELPGTPRRLLLITESDGTAPEQLSLSQYQVTPPTPPPAAEMELFDRSPEGELIWERHLLRLTWGANSLGFALGLRTGEEVHWWEACRLVILEETPECVTVEMGGAIPLRVMTNADLVEHPGYTTPFLHRHNWLNGHIYARLHSNGVCEIFAHHINSKFFDDGLPLHDAIPVVGFASQGDDGSWEELDGTWDGSSEQLQLGSVRLDLSEPARLATQEQPGRLHRDGQFVVWQPYEGMELYGGACPAEIQEDPFIFHSRDRVIPRGMARTLRFSLSLSDRSPRVVRYLAPAWWYGVCEEFLPESLLPVSDHFDGYAIACSRWANETIVRGGFEDGSLPRHRQEPSHPAPPGRFEPGWEGEVPYALFLRAWRTGDADDYQNAMRAAWYFTDVVVDHASKLARMHGHLPNAFSVPMNRVQGTLAAYLETGDPYLLETAQSVTANAHWTHKNSWPRLSVGRDGCYIRSAVLLYRYFGTDFFRDIAREGALSIVRSQRADGCFGDQGGGTGIHQWGGYTVKPWMGLLALGGVLDYLELFPGEAELRQCVLRFADWLLAARLDRSGALAWAYEYEFDGKPYLVNPKTGARSPLPDGSHWHQDTLARLLGWATFETGDPIYLDAWLESRAAKTGDPMDHSVAATLQFVPWLQAKLSGARLTENGIEVSPPTGALRWQPAARILGPKN